MKKLLIFLGATLFVAISIYSTALIRSSLREFETIETRTILADFSGAVKIVRAYEVLKEINTGMSLDQGDRLVTMKGGSAQIELFDGSLLRIPENARIELAQIKEEERKIRIIVFRGRLFGRVTKDPARLFNVLTKNTVVRITGTDLFVDYDSADNATLVQVFEGTVTLFDKNKLEERIEVGGGQGFQVGNLGAERLSGDLFAKNKFPDLKPSGLKDLWPILRANLTEDPLTLLAQEWSVVTGDASSDMVGELSDSVPDQEKMKKIRNDIKLIQLDMISYAAVNSKNATKVEELTLNEENKKDPWGRYYQIEDLGNGKVKLFSLGRDGMAGTPDDLF